MSIAQQLGYISVVEILKHVTTVEVEAPTATNKYKVVVPEVMQEDRMDSDEEGGKFMPYCCHGKLAIIIFSWPMLSWSSAT